MIRTLRLVAAAASLGAIATLAGCYYPGGAMASGCAETYESTAFLPVTLTIQNAATRETIWTCDVPVGQQLVILFNSNTRPSDPLLPDSMDWELMPAGTHYGNLENSVPMPTATSRRLVPKYRKGPEAPPPATADSGQPLGGGL
jgi:hypothetical protein